MENATNELLKSLRATAGSRFNASKRLSHVDKRLTALTAFTSAVIIALTVFPKFIDVSPRAGAWIELMTVAMSILLLASSVLQYASNHAVKSELFHRSALDIQELKRQLQFRAQTIDTPDFLKISADYNDVLQKYSLNHDDVDFYRYQIENPSLYQLGKIDILSKRAEIKTAYGYPSIFLFLVIVFGVGTIFLSLPETHQIFSAYFSSPAAGP
ncbi:hypothetical protein ASF03_21325 [Rhizobium sp. Leaf68]|nr:hypothetical protein ASE62_20780 [Rhizobium sp. Leaf202]KQN80466.1 hypothetical protein ASF03_21325 [Rhizobium sp. Leaf68]